MWTEVAAAAIGAVAAVVLGRLTKKHEYDSHREQFLWEALGAFCARAQIYLHNDTEANKTQVLITLEQARLFCSADMCALIEDLEVALFATDRNYENLEKAYLAIRNNLRQEVSYARRKHRN